MNKEGQSAYEIAKQLGFHGTIEEWLNSLKTAVPVNEYWLDEDPDACSESFHPVVEKIEKSPFDPNDDWEDEIFKRESELWLARSRRSLLEASKKRHQRLMRFRNARVTLYAPRKRRF
jgi:hypothetical protein